MIKRIKLSLIAAAMLVAAPFAAQAGPLGMITVGGVMAGANFSSISSAVDSANSLADGNIETKGAMGFQIGAKYGIDLPFIEVAPEIWYVNNNGSASINGMPEQELNSQSVEVPIIVSVGIIPMLKIKAGPSFNLWNSTKLADGVDLGNTRSTYGYVIGVGISLLNKVEVDVRYNAPFKSSVTPWGFENNLPMAEIKQSSFSVVAGWRF